MTLTVAERNQIVKIDTYAQKLLETLRPEWELLESHFVKGVRQDISAGEPVQAACDVIRYLGIAQADIPKRTITQIATFVSMVNQSSYEFYRNSIGRAEKGLAELREVKTWERPKRHRTVSARSVTVV